MSEPQIHSFNSDALPEAHPWAHETINCGRCNVMVHAFNNECMQPWVEHQQHALCMPCFRLMDCPTCPKRFVEAAGAYPCV